MGTLLTQLWVTVETQAIYIKELKERLAAGERLMDEHRTLMSAQIRAVEELSAQLNSTRAHVSRLGDDAVRVVSRP